MFDRTLHADYLIIVQGIDLEATKTVVEPFGDIIVFRQLSANELAAHRAIANEIIKNKIHFTTKVMTMLIGLGAVSEDDVVGEVVPRIP
jgi:hypothetical protein